MHRTEFKRASERRKHRGSRSSSHGVVSALSQRALRLQSDERLVELARSGYEQPFAAIVQRYRDSLVGYCAKLIGRDRAEDVVQQTFIRVADAIADHERELQLKPWLYRVAHNMSIDVLRKKGSDYAELDGEQDAGSSPHQVFEQRQDLKQLLTQIADLPEPQRAAVLLRGLEGRSSEEIAAQLQTSAPYVNLLVHRARTKLRNGMGLLLPLPLLRRLLASSDTQGVEAAVAGAGGGASLLKVVAALVAVGAVVVGGDAATRTKSESYDRSQLAGGSQGSAQSARSSAHFGGRTRRSERRKQAVSGHGPAADTGGLPATDNLESSPAPKRKAGVNRPGKAQPTEQYSATAADTGASGAADGGASGSATVASWRSSALTSPGPLPSGVARLASDAAGNTTAVWPRASSTPVDGTGAWIEAAVRSPGGDFGPAERISGGGERATSPNIAVNSQGAAVAAWESMADSPSPTVIRVATREPGGSFGAGEVISDSGSQPWNPEVAIDDAGNTVAVWEDRMTADHFLVASVRPAGGSFGAPQAVSASGPDVHGKVAIDARGDMIAVWTRYLTNLQTDVEAAIAPAGGQFQPPVRLSATLHAQAPDLGTDAQGNTIVVWEAGHSGPTSDTFSSSIEVAQRAPGGSFEKIQTISNPQRLAAEPKIAVDADGTAYLAWGSEADGHTTSRVDAGMRPPGGSFSSHTVSPSGTNSYAPEVASDDQGNAMVVWRSSERYPVSWSDPASAGVIQGVIRTPGRDFGESATISDPAEDAYDPKPTIGAGPRFQVLWNSVSKSLNSVFAIGEYTP